MVVIVVSVINGPGLTVACVQVLMTSINRYPLAILCNGFTDILSLALIVTWWDVNNKL